MLFPALGLTTAMWLVMTPLLGVEDGVRAALCVTVGVLALVLLPFGVWARKASYAAGALGIVLGFANLVLDGPIEAFASLATCATLLMLGGMAPWPVSEMRVAVALPETLAKKFPRTFESAGRPSGHAQAA